MTALKDKVVQGKVKWTLDCERAISELKGKLTAHPFFALDFTTPACVQTDASDIEVSAVLSQKDTISLSSFEPKIQRRGKATALLKRNW